MSLQRFVLAFLVVLGSTLSALGQVTLPVASRTTTYIFPPVGLGSTETLQVNVANLASNPAAGSPASCAASVEFIDASGVAIERASSLTATAGQTTSVKLTSTQAGTGVRGEVRVAITLTITSGVACSAVYSLETYDTSSGATHVYQTASGPVSLPLVR